MMNRPIYPSVLFAGKFRLVVACCIVFAATVSADSLQAGIDTFFIRLSGDFDRIAANPVVKKRLPSVIDPYFFRQLKRHQVVRSITRTNAKGICLTEMVRMKGADHSKQNLKEEQWFAEIIRGAQEYHALEKDTGRYYLIWSKPVASAGASSAKQIAGVVMMKIDLWDCFQEISNTTETPFLVYLKKVRFYDHKWKKSYEYDEVPLSIPGAEEMTLHTQKIVTPPPPAPDSIPAAVNTAPAKIDSTPATSGFAFANIKAKLMKNPKLGILAGVAGMAFLLVIIALLVSWIRNQMVIRAINKDL